MTPDDTPTPTDDATTDTRELTVSRVIDATPERIYQAFVDPDELGEWMHPDGFSAEVHDLTAEEGGSYRITMAGVGEGMADYGHTYGGTFEELVPGERIVQTEVFDPDDSPMAGEMTITTTFDEVPDGTEVTVTIELPAAWPDDAIGGWSDALDHLVARLEDE